MIIISHHSYLSNNSRYKDVLDSYHVIQSVLCNFEVQSNLIVIKTKKTKYNVLPALNRDIYAIFDRLLTYGATKGAVYHCDDLISKGSAKLSKFLKI